MLSSRLRNGATIRTFPIFHLTCQTVKCEPSPPRKHSTAPPSPLPLPPLFVPFPLLLPIPPRSPLDPPSVQCWCGAGVYVLVFLFSCFLSFSFFGAVLVNPPGLGFEGSWRCQGQRMPPHLLERAYGGESWYTSRG